MGPMQASPKPIVRQRDKLRRELNSVIAEYEAGRATREAVDAQLRCTGLP